MWFKIHYCNREEIFFYRILEMLVVTWAIKKCHIYLFGKRFIIQTDHKSLTSILDKQVLNDIANPRLQRMRENIFVYKFTTEWIKG